MLVGLLAAGVLGGGRVARADCPFDRPVELAAQGPGWLIPATWSHRGLNYGTPSMVALIKRAAKRVTKARPGATLYVGDLSLARGGATEWHRSHKCGRDADLLFYAVGVDGQQAAPPSTMIPFDADGFGYADSGDKVRFDTPRNWALVKALLEDRVPVEKLFINDVLRQRLLAYAKGRKEPRRLIERAAALMSQPSGVGPHDDHLHVRIAALGADRAVAKAKHKAGKRKASATATTRKATKHKVAKTKTKPKTAKAKVHQPKPGRRQVEARDAKQTRPHGKPHKPPRGRRKSQR